LNNIVRHGLASEVEFRLAVVDNILEIAITDNGKGFDPSTARPGSGLKNLSTRLTNHGGACHVESALGKGTKVTIRLPLSDVAKPETAPPTRSNRT
jgi:signal transduction histidine kinase